MKEYKLNDRVCVKSEGEGVIVGRTCVAFARNYDIRLDSGVTLINVFPNRLCNPTPECAENEINDDQ